jgi:hypothetical protein
VAISGKLPQFEAAMTDNNVTLPPTLPLQEFAQVAFELSENSAYAAARRGDIPTIRVGGLLKVPVRVALAKMAGGDPEVLKALTADFAFKLSQIKGEAA